jgi:DNA repair protein RadC
MNTNSSQVPLPILHKIPVYEVRLVKVRRPLRLAESIVPEANSAARTMHAMLGLTDREHFAALFLNGKHHVTGAHVIAIGSQHGIAAIDARTTFRAAIAACASAIVLGHNHPSGDPSPSPEDLATTASLMKAGRILGIPVLDHVIVTRDSRRWHSMLEHGTLPIPDVES